MGLLTDPEAHTPGTHSQSVAAPAARPKDGRSGEGERQTLDIPHQGKRRPSQAPLCRYHSAQGQLA